jgi:ARID/BRIGHT DNA binding domain
MKSTSGLSTKPQFPIPKELEFNDDEDERRKCQDFKEHLIKFQRELGVENFKVPSLGGRELDLCKLYKAVISRGGSHRVSNNKLWKEIVNEFEIPASCTSASFTLRNHYNKCLLQYEKKYFLGAQYDHHHHGGSSAIDRPHA